MGSKRNEALLKYGQILEVGGKEPLVVARDREVELLDRQLTAGRSMILLGPSGCGKTAVIHEVARRLRTRSRKARHILETTSGMMLVDTKYLGEWQTRVRQFCTALSGRRTMIVYFTDIHLLMNTGRSENNEENIGAFMRPFIERGEIVVLGECSPDEYRQGVERFPTFHKLFDMLRMEPLSPAATRTVVTARAEHFTAQLEADTGLRLLFPEAAIDRLLELSTAFLANLCAPGNAVQLLEQVVEGFRNHRPASEEILEVRPDQVIQALENHTGLPGLLLDDSRSLDLSAARQFFESRVLGQPAAIRAVIDIITLIKAGLTDPGKPMGIFFFVGPTGVGKTELAKALAEYIFGSEERLLRFDMSEYKDYGSFEKLIGSPHAPASSPARSGTLTSRVREQPFAVILFDEIEKAHQNVFDIFLQVFDDGRLTDAAGRTTNFVHTIIIMTSNVGSSSNAPPGGIGFGASAPPIGTDEYPRAMREFFRPEFLNRLDWVVEFKALAQADMQKIVRREIGQVLLRSGISRRQLRIDVDPSVYEFLIDRGFSQKYGARPLKRTVVQEVLLPIGRQIVQLGGEEEAPLIQLTADGERVHAKRVRDRASRRKLSAKTAVAVRDPLTDRKIKVTPDSLKQELGRVESKLADVLKTCEDAGLSGRKSDLIAEMSAIDFWDDLERSRQVQTEVYRLERILEAVERVTKRTHDLVDFAAAEALTEPARLAAVAERLADVRRHQAVVSYSLACRDSEDRRDAFLDITMIDNAAADDDIVGTLTDVYTTWARSKGFSARVIHEEVADRITNRLILFIEGVAVSGILRQEDGIHEFVYGRTEDRPKQSKYIRVRVLPLQDGAATDAEVKVQAKNSRGKGIRIKRRRSRVIAKIPKRGLSFTLVTPFDTDAARDIVEDYAGAELAARQHPDRDSGSDTVRRKYNMGPQKGVKDPQTGISAPSLEALSRGGLDDFLAAGMS